MSSSFFVQQGLRFGFKNTANTPIPDNINDKHGNITVHGIQIKCVFSELELQNFKQLALPYIYNMKIKTPVYMRGDSCSSIIFNRAEKTTAPVVFYVVKQVMEEGAPNYSVNFGLGYQPTSTLNFSEVLRLGRMHFERVFSNPQQQGPVIGQLT